MRGTSGTRSSSLRVIGKSISVTSTTSELYSQAFAHKVGTVEGCEGEYVINYVRDRDELGVIVDFLTRNDVARIHCILVFDESESIHKFNLGDFASAMRVEMSFNISFGCY